ncbi:MAG: ATP-binding cassette domain-containing protein [Bacteroidota bacterium]
MLEAINLTKEYGSFTVLNLKIEKEEILYLLGQNGIGKTTTINLFLEFVETTSGKVLINGVEVKQNNVTTKKIVANIPEVVQLYGNLSGIGNLDFFSQLTGFSYSHPELRKYYKSKHSYILILNPI